jgi:hypothetical protein
LTGPRSVHVANFRDNAIRDSADFWCLYVSDYSWLQSVQSTDETTGSKGSTYNQTEGRYIK